MLFVLFQTGPERYAVEAARVEELLPRPATLRPLAKAPPEIAGLTDHRGAILPVVDLCQILLGRPAAPHAATRMLVVKCGEVRLGLVVERACETLRREPGEFQATGVSLPDAPYLGPMTRDGRGLVQWVEPERLLPPAVRQALSVRLAEEVAA
ncbi:MAG: purine-binding chemotaxis protein CheW [Verrucomicrobia bacterium]|nr:purine-binding chemotaxis protein CheW [Verrucomicrobiota bacterium]